MVFWTWCLFSGLYSPWVRAGALGGGREAGWGGGGRILHCTALWRTNFVQLNEKKQGGGEHEEMIMLVTMTKKKNEEDKEEKGIWPDPTNLRPCTRFARLIEKNKKTKKEKEKKSFPVLAGFVALFGLHGIRRGKRWKSQCILFKSTALD